MPSFPDQQANKPELRGIIRVLSQRLPVPGSTVSSIIASSACCGSNVLRTRDSASALHCQLVLGWKQERFIDYWTMKAVGEMELESS